MNEARVKYVGVSSDGRTNRWQVDCACGYAFRPITTLYVTQHVQCPRCLAEYVATWKDAGSIRPARNDA